MGVTGIVIVEFFSLSIKRGGDVGECRLLKTRLQGKKKGIFLNEFFEVRGPKRSPCSQRYRASKRLVFPWALFPRMRLTSGESSSKASL